MNVSVRDTQGGLVDARLIWSSGEVAPKQTAMMKSDVLARFAHCNQSQYDTSPVVVNQGTKIRKVFQNH